MLQWIGLLHRAVPLDIYRIYCYFRRFSQLDDGSLHSLACMLPFLPHTDLTMLADIQAAQILSCPLDHVLSGE